jgi:hypothetical protein
VASSLNVLVAISSLAFKGWNIHGNDDYDNEADKGDAQNGTRADGAASPVSRSITWNQNHQHCLSCLHLIHLFNKLPVIFS